MSIQQHIKRTVIPNLFLIILLLLNFSIKKKNTPCYSLTQQAGNTDYYFATIKKCQRDLIQAKHILVSSSFLIKVWVRKLKTTSLWNSIDINFAFVLYPKQILAQQLFSPHDNHPPPPPATPHELQPCAQLLVQTMLKPHMCARM